MRFWAPACVKLAARSANSHNGSSPCRALESLWTKTSSALTGCIGATPTEVRPEAPRESAACWGRQDEHRVGDAPSRVLEEQVP